MITFKQFLSEAAKKPALAKNVSKSWDVENMSVDKMIEMVNTHCRESLRAIYEPHGLLFRGFKQAPGPAKTAVMLDSSNASRMSRDSNNLYQLLMDISPDIQKKGIPSRTKSFICITDYYSARGHGTAYVMLPFNGTTIAYTDSDDIFNSEISIKPLKIDREGPEDFGGTLGKRLKRLGILPDFNGKYTNADAINAQIAKIPAEIIAATLFDGDDDPLDTVISRKFFYKTVDSKDRNKELNSIHAAFNTPGTEHGQKTLLEILKKYSDGLTPRFKKNLEITKQHHEKFMDYLASFITTSQFSIKTVVSGCKLPYDVECWFSGKCIAIPVLIFKKMLIKMKANGTKIHPKVWDTFEDII